MVTSSQSVAATAQDVHQRTRQSRDSPFATWSSLPPFVCHYFPGFSRCEDGVELPAHSVLVDKRERFYLDCMPEIYTNFKPFSLYANTHANTSLQAISPTPLYSQNTLFRRCTSSSSTASLVPSTARSSGTSRARDDSFVGASLHTRTCSLELLLLHDRMKWLTILL